MLLTWCVHDWEGGVWGGSTAQVMQEHLGPLVHRGMDAMDDTTSHVEEVIFHVRPVSCVLANPVCRKLRRRSA